MAVITVGNTEGGANDYDVTVGAGAVDASVQRVTLASDDPAVALLATIDADTGGILTAVQALDNAVAGNEFQVDVITLPDQVHRNSAYETLATPLDAELDSITNGNLTNASAAIDNTTTRHRHCAFTLTLGAQSARTAGANIAIYRNDALDGTNYDSVDAAAQLLTTIPLPTGTAAGQWTRVVRNCLPPGLFKVFAGNYSTQTTASSANLLEIRMFSDEIG
jgi:hypothetical protein